MRELGQVYFNVLVPVDKQKITKGGKDDITEFFISRLSSMKIVEYLTRKWEKTWFTILNHVIFGWFKKTIRIYKYYWNVNKEQSEKQICG